MTDTRLCLATDSAEPSGVGQHMLTLADGARACAIDVTIVAAEHTDLYAQAARRGHAVQAYAPDCAAWFAAARFPLVHVHAGIGWEGHDLTAAAAASGARVIRTEHLPFLLTDRMQIELYHARLQSVTRVVAVSAGVADTLIAAGVPQAMIAVIPNGADAPPRRRTRRAVRRSQHLDDQPVVIHIGRFTAQKRHAALVDAWVDVRRTVPEARLWLVGRGPAADEVATQIARLGQAEAICCLGQRSDIGDLMGAADLLVLPSAFEGMPLVLIEAMAIGLPALVTRVAGVADWVDDNVAWVVEAGSSDALAAGIAAALDDPAGRAARRAAARQLHRAALTTAAMQRATVGLYRSLCQEAA